MEIKQVKASLEEIEWAKNTGQANSPDCLNGEIINDPALEKYLDSLVKKVLSRAPSYFKGFAYKVRVIKNPWLYALAFPNGEIFIGSKFFYSLEFEDVLVGMLAHEISHVALRHKIGEFQMSRKLQNEQLKFVGKAKDFARIENRNSVLLAKYFQYHETESDLMAIRILLMVGYDASKYSEYMLMHFVNDKNDKEHPSAQKRFANTSKEIEVWKRILHSWKPIPHPMINSFLEYRSTLYSR
ncbi:MAG: M48 family metalloprotease [Patescibacteria group bacterium]|nr:M48 family metalloprotease [Patescibacteria group bacterium]